MPRVKADNYDAKRSLILDKAAKLFAESSYPSTRMMDIAEACGTSKSMLYHYFPKKDDLLYAILIEHLEEIIIAIKQLPASLNGNITGNNLIRAFVDLFLQQSAKARTRHIVAMLDVKYLPKKQQTTIKNLEREIIAFTVQILKQANTNLQESEYTFYALLLIGTINSIDIWKKPKGAYNADEMSSRVTELFLNGFLTAKTL